MNASAEVRSGLLQHSARLNRLLHLALAIGLAVAWELLLELPEGRRFPVVGVLVFFACFGPVAWKQVDGRSPWGGVGYLLDMSIRVVGIFLIVGRVFFHAI